jgi:hypothetical protein
VKYLFFWKGKEEANFRRTETGYQFFPYGPWGRGYEVDEAKKVEIAKFIRTYYTYATVVLLVGILTNYWIPLALLVPLIAYYVLRIRRLVASAPISKSRTTYGQSQARVASTASTARLTFVICAGILMTAGGAFLLLTGVASGNRENTITGAIAFLFFGFCLLSGIRMAWLKGRAPKANRPS